MKCFAKGIFLITVFSIACTKKEEDKKTTTVKVGVSLSEDTSDFALNPPQLKLTQLQTEGRLSFTPTSIKLGLKTGSATKGYSETEDGIVPSNSEASVNGSAGGFNFEMSKTVDLIGSKPFIDLSDSVITVDEGAFGDYFVIGMAFDQTVKVSGSITGTSYSFSDLEVTLGNPSAGLLLPEAVTVDADHAPSIKLLFSVKNSFYVSPGSSNPNSGTLSDGTTRIITENLPVVPYVGDSNPVVESYIVRLSSATAFGDPNKWHLRVVVFKNAADELITAT